MSQSTQKFDIDNQQLSLAGSDLSISKGNTVTLPFAIPTGGLDGQLLAKQSDTNYDVTWVNETPASSYTSVIKHKVKAGESLTKGQAVYVSSADGTNMIVTKASNISEATSSKTMGLVAQTLANNGQGDIIAEGLLSGLNTNTAIIGDPVWLGTNGNLIYGLVNKPYAPAHLVFIGIVTRVSATVGEIFVKVQNGFELNEIHDVDLKTTPPVNGDILGYNGTLWVNKSITKTTVGLSNVDNTSDASKPVSTATQTALNLKANLSGDNTFTGNNTFRGYIISNGAGGIATNTAIGFEALNTNTTGNLNTANGVASLYSNTTGASNTANGVASLYSNTTGASNTTNGVASLYSNTTGYENTANGISSLYSNTTGFSNTANGVASGYDITTGSNNTLLGKRAGRGITTGSNNTILGANQIDLVNTLSSTVSISDGSGNKRFYSPSTGNVLFGSETDTGEKLQVNGTSKFTDVLYTQGGTSIFQNSSRFGNTVLMNAALYTNSLNSTTLNSIYLATRPTANVIAVQHWVGVDSQTYWNTSNGSYNWQASGVNRMTLQSTGELGIGTTLPQNLLHVKGTASVGVGVRSSHLTIESAETAGVGVGAVLKFAGQSGNTVNPYSFGTIEARKESAVANNYSSYMTFHTIDNTGGSTERMRISGNGNIGIGTDAPTLKLQVEGTGYTTALIRSSTTTAGGLLTLSNTARSYSLGARGDFGTGQFNIVDETAGLARFSIFSTGRVGIGTTTDAGYLLDVNGIAQATQFKLSVLNTAPASATAAGTTGEIRVTATHIYVCTTTNTWVRSALTTW